MHPTCQNKDCGGTEFSSTSNSFSGTRARIVYCKRCGCVVGVVNASVDEQLEKILRAVRNSNQ